MIFIFIIVHIFCTLVRRYWVPRWPRSVAHDLGRWRHGSVLCLPTSQLRRCNAANSIVVVEFYHVVSWVIFSHFHSLAAWYGALSIKHSNPNVFLFFCTHLNCACQYFWIEIRLNKLLKLLAAMPIYSLNILLQWELYIAFTVMPSTSVVCNAQQWWQWLACPLLDVVFHDLRGLLCDNYHLLYSL